MANYHFFPVVLSLLFFALSLQAKTEKTLMAKKLPINVTYDGTSQKSYAKELLQHVLSYDQKNSYNLTAFGKNLPTMRAFDLLGKSNGLDITVAGATIKREQLALAIRFPIMQGLYGWRVPLVHEDNKDIFINIKNLEQFKQLKALQFHTWSDSETLRLNSIRLIKGSDVEGLYLMLDKKRADYFPRSVLEVDHDLAAHRNLAITKEQNTLIWYPKAMYFYVGKNQKAFAKVIRDGLELALNDGSLEKLFMRYYGDTITQLKNEQRRVFKLLNPLLSPLTPLERPELWLDLSHATAINHSSDKPVLSN